MPDSLPLLVRVALVRRPCSRCRPAASRRAFSPCWRRRGPLGRDARLHLHAPTLDLLDELGAAEPLIARASPRPPAVPQPRGGIIAEFDFAFFGRRYSPPLPAAVRAVSVDPHPARAAAGPAGFGLHFGGRAVPLHSTTVPTPKWYSKAASGSGVPM